MHVDIHSSHSPNAMSSVRSSLFYSVREQSDKSGSFWDLLFTLGDKKKTIVYFNNALEAVEAGQFLRSQNSEARIGVFHAVFSDGYKARIMNEFKDNKLDLLLTTEVGGVRYEFNGVERVIQWGYPPSMSSLVRRFDGAARNPDIQGQAILLVPSLTPDEKDVDDNVYRYITTTKCRRQTLSEILDSLHIPKDRTRQGRNIPAVTTPPVVGQARKERRYPRRTEVEKLCFRLAIKEWRAAFCHDSLKGDEDFEPEEVISDSVMELLAEECQHITNPRSVSRITAKTWDALYDSHKEELSEKLVELNDRIEAARKKDRLEEDDEMDEMEF